jgi:FAD-linked sulfhydryl oxidase
MTLNDFKEEVKEACRACIDVKSWFKETKMKTSASISKDIGCTDPLIQNPTQNRVSSNGLVCPPDANELGRGTWTFLHSVAAYLPKALSESEKENMINLLRAVSALYPCKKCADHMSAYIEVNPISFDSKDSISLWLCRFHNEVNEMLGKSVFDCSKVYERWKTGPKDDSCSEI